MSIEEERFIFMNFGFFLYVVDGDACAHVVVPKTEGVAHANVLFLPTGNTTIDGFLPAALLGDEYLAVDMHGVSVTIDPPSPAMVGRRSGTSIDEPDFDWVPDLTKAWCGIKLHSVWQQSPGVDSIVTLSEGALNALPDAHTCDRIWTWDGCHGEEHRQRVTALTAYAPTSTALTLIFRNTATGGHMATATMTTSPEWPAAHFSIPVANLTGLRPPRDEVEFTHMQAIMRVCARGGAELRVPARRDEPTPCESRIGIRANLVGFLQKFLILHEGTIECSGGSIPNP